MELRSGEKASYNFFRLLRTIWEQGSTSRTELARLHGLDKTTVSTIVSEFVASGVVKVADVDTSNVRPGRRSEILAINEGWGYVAGLEFRPDSVTACATDMRGRVITTHRNRQPIERSNLLDAFVCGLESLRNDAMVGDRPLVGVGVGVSGIVRRGDSVIVHSIPLNIHEPLDLRQLVNGTVVVPLVVDNDANCCAWSELVFDRTETPSNSLFVLLDFRDGPTSVRYGGGVGLGLGFVINRSVYYGENGSAGEFRSIAWHPGNSSQFAIPDTEVVDILERPESLKCMLQELSQHIALFVNTLNLRKVYVGGDAALIGEEVVQTIRTAMRTNWPYDEPVDCVVQLATSDAETVSVGAAAMVLERIFEEPVLPSGLRDRNEVWAQIMKGRRPKALTG